MVPAVSKAATEVEASNNMDLSEANLGLVSLELNRDHTSKQWPLNGYEHEDEVNHILKLHQVIVDRKAIKDEEQVIEVEFFPNMGNKVSMPLAYLKRGSLDQLTLEINFPAGTTFRLAEGQGPVYLLGSHSITQASEEDVGESEDVEEEEDEEDEDVTGDSHEIKVGEVVYEQGKAGVAVGQGGFDDTASKKRKQDSDRENGTDPKKLKATPPSANSDSDADREEDEDSPSME